MKRFVLLIVALFCASAFADELPRIAVYVTGDVSDNEKKALGTRMLASLINSKRYKGIERSNSFLAEIEREQERQRNGEIDDSQISQLGRQFGVKFVCIADITPAFGDFQVSARIVNVETAEVDFIGDASGQLKSMADLTKISEQVVKNMFSEAIKTASEPKPTPMPEPKPELTPDAPAAYTLAIADPIKGGIVSVNPQKTAYAAGEQVTVKAKPYSGYAFANWSGASSSTRNAVTVNMNGNLTLTANFLPTYKLTVTNQPSKGGIVSISLQKTAYTAGEQITVKAKPYIGYTFAGWSGADSSTHNTVTITMNDNLTLIANFQPKPKSEPKPNPEPKPKTGIMSVGMGGFLASDFGGGIKWSGTGEQIAMPYAGGGAYLYIDFKYAEVFVGISQGSGKWASSNASSPNNLPDMQRTCVNTGAFVKSPVSIGNVTFFSLLGIDYEISTAGRLLYDNGNAYAFDGENGRLATNALSALWGKAGGGVDLVLNRNAYLRAELLYGFRMANTFETDCVNDKLGYGYRSADNTRLGHGVTLKMGVGIKI